MTADPRALAELLEQSQDLQADALRPTHEALDELVETAHAQREDDPATNQAFHETHTRALTASLAGAALLGAAGGAVLAAPWPPQQGPAAPVTSRSCRPPPPSRTWRSPPTRPLSRCRTSVGLRPTRS